MVILALLLGLLGGALVGVGTAVVVVRAIRADVVANRDAAVAAAVGRLGVERDEAMQALVRELAADRESAMQATIETVLSVAGDKFGSHTAAASQQFGLRSEMFDEKVSGMNDELRRVSQLVAQLQKERAEQHGQLVQGINEAVRASTVLSTTTRSLREALSNSRARGQWGERMAEDVLRSAGFIEGVNYRKQHAIGGGGRPDLTFILPRDRVLHMDVKFPIDNYLRYLDTDSDFERDACCKAFLKDVRARIKELTVRDYIDPSTTVGYVLLFIPNEAVYGFIHEHDPAILDHALTQQVVLCSPFSLFAVLGVVRQAVDNYLVERTSDEIVQCLGDFSKQWDLFSARLDRLGAQFATAHKTYDDLAGTRRRQLQKQLDQVERLRSARGLESPAGLPEAGTRLPADVAAIDTYDSYDPHDLDDAGGPTRRGDDLPADDISEDHGRERELARVHLDDYDTAVGADHAVVQHPASGRRIPRLRPVRSR